MLLKNKIAPSAQFFLDHGEHEEYTKNTKEGGPEKGFYIFEKIDFSLVIFVFPRVPCETSIVPKAQ